MEDGRRRKASATRNGGRTAPCLSLRVASAVEATGEDPRSAESAVDPSQADGPVVVGDFYVCLSDDLATGSQPGDEPAAVLGEPAVAVSRAGQLAASGYAGPPAGEDHGEPDPGGLDRPDPATHPQQEILSLFDFALLSAGHRWNPEAAAELAVERAMFGAPGANQTGRRSGGDPAAILRVSVGSEASLCQRHDHPVVKRIPGLRSGRSGTEQTGLRSESLLPIGATRERVLSAAADSVVAGRALCRGPRARAVPPLPLAVHDRSAGPGSHLGVGRGEGVGEITAPESAGAKVGEPQTAIPLGERD